MIAPVLCGPWLGLTAATRRPGVPPTAEYLAEREGLGIPSQSAALFHACPWCRAPALQPCTIRATGRRRHPHDARIEATS